MNVKETITNVLNANKNAREKKEAEKNMKIAACGGLAATAVTAAVGFFRVRNMKKKYSELADTLETINSRLNVAEAKLTGIEGEADASNPSEEPNSEKVSIFNNFTETTPAENNNEQEENK